MKHIINLLIVLLVANLAIAQNIDSEQNVGHIHDIGHQSHHINGVGITDEQLYEMMPTSGNPEDEFWTLQTHLPGTNNPINAVVIFGDDVFVGGQFTIAGGVPANNIARYNLITNTWHALGDGVNGIVNALAIHGDDLYVGGQFFGAAGQPRYLARYNITNRTWHTFTTNVNLFVNTLYVVDDNLYVGGSFWQVGTQTFNRIARYNLENGTWHTLGTGGNNGVGSTVHAIIAVGNYIYVGGEFTTAGGDPASRVARYHVLDDTWEQVGAGLNQTVRTFASVGEMVFAGGDFQNTGGDPVSRVARFDSDTNSWLPLGSGAEGVVRRLQVVGNHLYVGGAFQTAGGVFGRKRIARYDFSGAMDPADNTRWSTIGAGLSSTVHDIRLSDGNLFMVGIFQAVEAPEFMHAFRVVRYNVANETWHQLGQGLDYIVTGLHASENNLFIGGDFIHVDGVQVNRVVRYNMLDNTWHPMGDGVNNYVFSFAVDGDNVYAGGDFSQAGHLTEHVVGIARYHIPTNMWHQVSGGTSGNVRDMIISGDNLYIAGVSVVNGPVWGAGHPGIPVNSFARFHIPTQSWHDVGGVTGGTIWAMVEYGDYIIVGGSFTAADGEPTNRIARFNKVTEEWSAFDEGISHASINSMAISGDLLFVGGAFSEAGGNPANNIAMYNLLTEEWFPLGNGVNNRVDAISVSGNDVFAGGMFSPQVGQPGRWAARYNLQDETWYALGSGVNARVTAMERAPNTIGAGDGGGVGPIAVVEPGHDIILGGDFSTAGEKAASKIARWSGSRSDNFSLEIPGPNEGWRMIGSPLHGTTYEALFGNSIWTQGFPGAASEFGNSNIYWLDESNRTNSVSEGWRAPSHITDYIAGGSFHNAGRGVLAYVFEDDDYDGIPDGWPKTLNVSGIPYFMQQTMNLSYTEPADVNRGWHLIANPFPFSIFWDLAIGTLVNTSSTIYIWDSNRPGGADYRVSGPGGDFGGIIAPFQAFWVRALDNGASVSFHTGFEAAGGSFYDLEPGPPSLKIMASQDELTGWASLVFDTDGYNDPRKYNAVRLNSMALEYLHLYSSTGTQDRWQVTHLPETSEESLLIPLYIDHTGDGTITLTAEGISDLSGISIYLIDNVTGYQAELKDDFQFSFDPVMERKLSGSEKSNVRNLTPRGATTSVNEKAEARFSLLIQYTATNTEQEINLPDRFELGQNYPNPFNPVTNIRYNLPEATDVKLEVYNVIGQRVAVLVNGFKNPGFHTVAFDGTRLSSGVYIYRITAGNFTETRKMVLVK